MKTSRVITLLSSLIAVLGLLAAWLFVAMLISAQKRQEHARLAG